MSYTTLYCKTDLVKVFEASLYDPQLCHGFCSCCSTLLACFPIFCDDHPKVFLLSVMWNFFLVKVVASSFVGVTHVHSSALGGVEPEQPGLRPGLQVVKVLLKNIVVLLMTYMPVHFGIDSKHCNI